MHFAELPLELAKRRCQCFTQLPDHVWSGNLDARIRSPVAARATWACSRPAPLLSVKRGIEEAEFILVDRIEPGQRGAILAVDSSLDDLHARLNANPFCVKGILNTKI